MDHFWYVLVMILYPTETVYALGVSALDEAQIAALFALKGRSEGKSVSWLVRDVADIERWGVLSPLAAKIAENFLPGPLTLVLQAKDTVLPALRGPDNTVSFRISLDPVAQELITKYMTEYDAPLTCTSANVSGLLPQPNVPAILEQFGEKAAMITEAIDDGRRTGEPSTVVKVVDDSVEIIREGAIPTSAILEVKG